MHRNHHLLRVLVRILSTGHNEQGQVVSWCCCTDLSAARNPVRFPAELTYSNLPSCRGVSVKKCGALIRLSSPWPTYPLFLPFRHLKLPQAAGLPCFHLSTMALSLPSPD